MSLRIADLTNRLFRRFVTKTTPPQSSRARLSVTALEDRTVPTPVITVINLADTVEGGSAGALRFTRTETAGSLTVNYEIGGTAFPGSDYTSIGTQVTFADGSATADVTVTALVDNLVEGNEAVAVIVLPYYNYMVGSPNSASVIIADDPPVVSVGTFSHAWEGGASGTFRFTRGGGDTSQTLTVNYSVSGTAAPGSDYTALTGTVTFVANSAIADVAVATINDGTGEPDEAVTVTISAYYNYTVGTPNSATVTIVDDDPLVSVYKRLDAIEGADSGGFVLVRGGNLGQPLTVNFTISGTATPGIDYTSLPTSAQFAADQNTVDLAVIPVNDGIPEPTEVVSLSLLTSPNYTLGTANAANVNLVDAPPPRPVGSGTGLFARYYNTKDLYDVKTARVDEKVEFNWNQNAPPGTAVGADNFSVQWVGRVQAQTTENYTFHTLSDDGVRLWVNGSLVIDNWTVHGPTPNDSAPIALVAEQMYDIKLEYFENLQGARIDLMWSSASLPVQRIIPKSQLYPVVFDLDVNYDNDLLDPVDGVADYLPGYEGNVQKVSAFHTFNTDTYTAQRLKLVLDGVGKNNANVTKVDFVITDVSNHGGYASNRSHASIVAGNDHDYSFLKSQNDVIRTITRTTTQTEGYGWFVDGQMEDTKTWVNFYAKDYGAWGKLEARVFEGGATPAYTLKLTLPKDTEDTNGDGTPDGDRLADKWEIQMGHRWASQYGLAPSTAPAALARFSPLLDGEEKDPDGKPQATRPLEEQKEEGDAHTVLEEYRGYILDGGGFDGDGANGHTGGHIRLDPARKEILVEVDRAATLNNLPMGGLASILGGATKVFSNASRGTGLYVYYLIDETLNVAEADVNTETKQRDVLRNHRDTAEARAGGVANLRTDFVHNLILDTGVRAAGTETGAHSFESSAIPALERGVVTAISDMKTWFDTRPAELGFTKFDELLMTTFAHEYVHLLIEKKLAGGFNALEHVVDPDQDGTEGNPADRTELMYRFTTSPNRELGTVKIFSIVQREMETKSSLGLIQ